jgi:hypothetical protein
MTEIAEDARYEPDEKTKALINWIRDNLCPELPAYGEAIQPGAPTPTWNERRVLIFTENRQGTKRHIETVLAQAIGIAARMDATPELEVTLLLNIGRKPNNTTTAADLVTAFTNNLWTKEWPGRRRPDVYYDPRSLHLTQPEGVLHAKALVIDELACFIGSANLTQAAFDRNFEAGVLSRDPALAASWARHFRTLVEHGKVEPFRRPQPELRRPAFRPPSRRSPCNDSPLPKSH